MRGIIGKSNGSYITGEFEKSHNSIVVYSRRSYEETAVKDYTIVEDEVFFSTLKGIYYWKKDFSWREVFRHINAKNKGLYPYSFAREYEAVNHFALFANKQRNEYNYNFLGANDIPFTFGLEFETSSGCIPENICFRDGLIPLRDGSITGPEYSTIVLQGNKGVNLLYQQLKTLRKYTAFNKECALHMHLGGYPVRKDFIFTLYSLCVILENDFMTLTNRDVFATSRYKKTGKDYCNVLPEYSTFDDFFMDIVGREYTGSLTDTHPNDADRNQKWHIHSRYRCVNFVNMLCYPSPKTVEFRFLRPTYNFTKIYTWLLLFTAILKFAEKLTSKFGGCSYSDICSKCVSADIEYDIRSICEAVYPKKLYEYLCQRIDELEVVSKLQYNNEDFSGSDTSFENELMTATFF